MSTFTTASDSKETGEEKSPNVDNFTEYFPWAVGQICTPGVNIIIRKMIDWELVSTKVHSVDQVRQIISTPAAKSTKSVRQIVSDIFLDSSDTPTITISANYNKGGYRLVGLRFEKGIKIPRSMVYVLGLIIKFHLKLKSVTFVRNADQYTIYELSTFLPVSNITEVCLDGCYVKEGNFHILLDENCNLKVLSLARCSITDTVLKLLIDKIVFPKPAGFFLNILNLSSNRITDVGAKYVADVLRLNRSLYHLNLADNSITEEGADEILNTFLNFPATEEEVLHTRQLLYKYLKEKNKFVNELVAGTTGSADTFLSKKYGSSTSLIKKKRKKQKVQLQIAKSKMLYDSLLKSVNKATISAQLALGMFQNPLAGQIVRNGVIFCAGNNTLRSLNLAYNSLSFNNVRKLLQVLRYQKDLNRKPRGLINVNIEGNRIPVACDELSEINLLLKLATRAIIGHPQKGRLHKSPSPLSKSSKQSILSRSFSDKRKFH